MKNETHMMNSVSPKPLSPLDATYNDVQSVVNPLLKLQLKEGILSCTM